MLLLEATIPGPPVPWMRARSNGRTGARFTAPKDAAHRRAIALVAASAMGGRDVVRDDVRISLRFYFPVPASMSRHDRERALCAGALRPRARVDVDNLSKAVLDACNGIVWHDDAQCVELWASKHYGEEPRTELRVHLLADVGRHGPS